jgi:hypothetical protein
MSTEQLANRRNRLLVLNAAAFVIWQAATFGPHLAGRSIAPTVIVLGLAGFVAWAWTLIVLMRPVADARVRAALNDELTRHHQRQAMLAGYWAMLGTAVGALAVASLVPIPAILVVRVIVVVGVAAPLLRFVVLERSDVGE